MPAPTIDRLTLADDAAGWERLGFSVDRDRCLLGSIEVELAGVTAGRGIVGWSLRNLANEDLDGLPTSRSERPEPDRAAPDHANAIHAIDHVVAISPDLDRTSAALQAAGLDLRRVREEPTPAGAPRQAFFRLGEAILELVQEPDEVIGRMGGAGRPAHFWGLALASVDLERTVRAFAPHVGTIRDAVHPGRRIATVRRSAGLSVPVALMSV